jgi:hypothetical protein
MPQPPQWLALVVVGVSQPLARLPSQLPKPVLHTMPHVLRAQNGVPLVPLHTVPQAPQWLGSKVTLVHEPEQLLSPAPQVVVHAPAEQT